MIIFDLDETLIYTHSVRDDPEKAKMYVEGIQKI